MYILNIKSQILTISPPQKRLVCLELLLKRLSQKPTSLSHYSYVSPILEETREIS